MITHTDRITLVFPIADKSRPAAASLQTLTVYDDGSERETVVPLDPEKVKDYSEAFSLPLVVERDKLSSDLQAITSEHDKQKAIADTVPGLQEQITELIAEKTTLTNEKSVLISEKSELQNQLAVAESLNTSLTAERDALQASLTTATTNVTALTSEKATITADLTRVRTERNTLRDKVAAMSAHPDVVADRKAKAIEEARALRVKAIQERELAEAKLAELGVEVEGE
jgi:chromosome segregation ATPase